MILIYPASHRGRSRKLKRLPDSVPIMVHSLSSARRRVRYEPRSGFDGWVCLDAIAGIVVDSFEHETIEPFADHIARRLVWG